jgi:hypothetical protein
VVRAWPRPYSVWREDSGAAEGYALAGSTAAPPSAEMIRDMLQVRKICMSLVIVVKIISFGGLIQGKSAVPVTENGFINFILESKKMWKGMSRL